MRSSAWRSERAAGASLRYPGYHAPRTLDELSAALLAHPDAVVLAGGTDMGLWVTKQLRDLPPLIFVGDVPELSAIEERPNELWIGAAVTLTDAWPALLHRFPELEEQAARFASPPIRNSATLCGNLANGSPIGDSIPALIALDARIELRKGASVRRLALEDFYLGYQKKALEQGRIHDRRRHSGRTGGPIARRATRCPSASTRIFPPYAPPSA